MMRDIKKSSILLAVLVILMLMVSMAGNAAAQDTEPPTDDAVNAIAKEMFCPVCENIPLDVCGTQACEQWRELIREKLADGWTENEIKEYFVLQYGDRVLAAPPARGLNWLVYVVPPAAFLLGAFLLYRGFKSWQTVDEPVTEAEEITEEAETAPADDYLARMEEELRRSEE